jgi:hypothetical protein
LLCKFKRGKIFLSESHGENIFVDGFQANEVNKYEINSVWSLQNRMKITLKLLANYRKYLPADAKGYVYALELPHGSIATDILKQFSVPVDRTSVILINGRTPRPGMKLKDGDVLCAFPVSAGG